jgi:exosortase
VDTTSVGLRAPAARAATDEPLAAAKIPPAGVLTLLGILVLYVPVFVHAVDVWRSDPEFSFGFVVPPIAIALLWFRRAALASAFGRGSVVGLVPLVGGLALFLVSARTGVHALAGASVLFVGYGVVAYLGGLTAARLTAFPLAFLTAGLSLYRGMFNSLGFALQQMTASASAPLASLMGVPVRQVGVDLFTGNLHLVVAQACSGLDSLVALLCLGAVFVGIGTGSLPRRAALFAVVLPIILAANIVRVTLVLVLFGPLGTSVTDGLVHAGLDVVVFIAAVFTFWFVAGALKCAPVMPAIRSS